MSLFEISWKLKRLFILKKIIKSFFFFFFCGGGSHWRTHLILYPQDLITIYIINLLWSNLAVISVQLMSNRILICQRNRSVPRNWIVNGSKRRWRLNARIYYSRYKLLNMFILVIFRETLMRLPISWLSSALSRMRILCGLAIF